MIDFYIASFFIISGIIVISAIMVLRCREVVHSAMFLALTFAMVGCIFILLNAEYIALVQIIIYAGAVTVLMLFAIMLTKRRILGDAAGAGDAARADTFYEFITAIFFLWLIILTLCSPAILPGSYGATLDRQLIDPGTMQELGALLFTGYILPFLMVGALLAVAMLGGVFMAREKEED